MVGVIDIGSNTIRLVVYDGKRRVYNSGLNSDIISDTKNGVLSEDGIKKLISAVSFLKEKSNGVDILAFGTYAMRVLTNKDIVRKRVFEATGVNIDVLTGEQEAEYDFYGLLGTINSNESGIGVDLGGGSAQILIFKDGKKEFLKSCPIGCKKILNKFIANKDITQKEREKIKSYIQFNLQSLKGNTANKIYMMGGTAKTALKLYGIMENNASDIISVKKIPELINFIQNTTLKNVRYILKNRYENVICGIIIMEEIANYFGAEAIHIKKCGVRDGYIYKNYNE